MSKNTAIKAPAKNANPLATFKTKDEIKAEKEALKVAKEKAAKEAKEAKEARAKVIADLKTAVKTAEANLKTAKKNLADTEKAHAKLGKTAPAKKTTKAPAKKG